MIHLSEKDRMFALMMKRAGILEHVNGHQFDRGGVALVYCGDCDLAPEYYDHLCRTIAVAHDITGYPRVHSITRNGGAIRFCRKSPANKPDRTTYLDGVDEIAETCKMKEVSQVATLIHAPCGKCEACNIGLHEAVRLQIEAKKNLKADVPRVILAMTRSKCLPRISIACFCSINWGQGSLTYYISYNKWMGWADKNADAINKIYAGE